MKSNEAFAEEQRRALMQKGLTEEQVERAMQPSLSFHAGLAEEVSWYELVRRREFKPISDLTHIGRLLIGLRIANGMTQKDLAERLGVSEPQVSRDERNEYHGITVERVQKILKALNESMEITIVEARYEPYEPTSPRRNPEPVGVT